MKYTPKQHAEHPLFEWRDGMLDGDSGLRFGFEFNQHRAAQDSVPLYPDITDPATAGCLEYILNEIAEVEQWEGKTHCHVADDGNYRKDFFMRTSGDCIGEVRAKAIKAIAKAEGVE